MKVTIYLSFGNVKRSFVLIKGLNN